MLPSLRPGEKGLDATGHRFHFKVSVVTAWEGDILIRKRFGHEGEPAGLMGFMHNEGAKMLSMPERHDCDVQFGALGRRPYHMCLKRGRKIWRQCVVKVCVVAVQVSCAHVTGILTCWHDKGTGS